MKRRPTATKEAAVLPREDPLEKVIRGGLGPSNRRGRSRTLTGKGKMPAAGLKRMSFDIPEELYRGVKEVAARRRVTMRECVEDWLKRAVRRELRKSGSM